jgi:hypothetical protein
MIKYKTRDGKIIYGVEGEDFISSSTLEELYDDSMVGDNAPFSTNLLSAYYDDAVDDEERKYIENYAKMHPKFAKEIRDFRHMMNYSETDNRETADNYPYQNQEPFATNNYYNNQFESKGTNKRLIRLTEQDLHKIVKESVDKLLNEWDELADIRWRSRDFHNNIEDAQKVGKKRGEALANWNKRIKDSEKNISEGIDLGETENIMAYDVFTENLEWSNRDSLLMSTLYDRNDRPVGRLNDLHFKYDAQTNDFI